MRTDGRIHRILFIRNDRMGDVLMNLPAVRTLRLGYSKAWIAMLVDRSVAPLLRAHPDLDELIEVDSAKLTADRAERRSLGKQIRSARFDLAVVSNPSKFWHSLVFFSRIPVRVGWRRKFAFFLTASRADGVSERSSHEIDRDLSLVSLVTSARWDGRIELPRNPLALKRVGELLKSEIPVGMPVVALHPGSSDAAKRWPVERFASLAERLSEQGKAVVVVGGPEERSNAEVILGPVKGVAVNLAGRLALDDLPVLFADPSVKALVSSDSGPVHVAWISGTPVVALYARTTPGSNPARWGPRDGKSRTIFKPIQEVGVEEVLTELAALR